MTLTKEDTTEKLVLSWSPNLIEVVLTNNGNMKQATFLQGKVEHGYFRLGDFVDDALPEKDQKGYPGKFFLVKDTSSDLLKKPEDFKMIWSSKGSKSFSVNEFSLWEPIAPKGYIAVGHAVSKTLEKPDVNNYRVVRADLLSKGVYEHHWDDASSGATSDVSCWKTKTKDPSKTFFFGGYYAVQQSNSMHSPPTTLDFWEFVRKGISIVPYPVLLKHVDEIEKFTKDLMNDKNYHDFCFETSDGKTLSGNKLILSTRGDKIKTILESTSGNIILDKRHSFHTLQLIVDYMYLGKINITNHNVYDVIALADKFGLAELKTECFKFIIKSLDKESVVQMLFKAKKKEFEFDPTELLVECNNFICKRAEEVFQTDHFLLFDKDTVASLVQNDLVSISEIDFFQCIVRWGNHQIKNNKEYNGKSLKEVLQGIVEYIRYPFISGVDLMKVVKPTGLCEKKIYLQALEFNMRPELYKGSTDYQFKSRYKIFHGTKVLDVSMSNLLKNWLPGKREWQLIYSGLRDGFTSQQFHSMCNGKGETVVIFQSSNDYVFGGYTPISWADSGSYQFDNKSFLFGLKVPGNNPQKLAHKTSNTNSIYNYSSYGPTFGGGHDIYICSGCNTSTGNYTNLGYTYDTPQGVYGSNEAKSYFCGGYNFQIKEIEVFVPKIDK